jgi:hypothetical protein
MIWIWYDYGLEIKCSLNKYVLSFFLKELQSSIDFSSYGSRFQYFGPVTEKLLSANVARSVDGIKKVVHAIYISKQLFQTRSKNTMLIIFLQMRFINMVANSTAPCIHVQHIRFVNFEKWAKTNLRNDTTDFHTVYCWVLKKMTYFW